MDLQTFVHSVINSDNNDPEKVVERFVEEYPQEWLMKDGKGNDVFDEAILQEALREVLEALTAAWSDDGFTQKIKAAFEAEKVFEDYVLFPESDQGDSFPKPLIELGVIDIAEMIGRTLVLKDDERDCEYYLQTKGATLFFKEARLIISIHPIEVEVFNQDSMVNEMITLGFVVVNQDSWILFGKLKGPVGRKPSIFRVFKTARIV